MIQSSYKKFSLVRAKANGIVDVSGMGTVGIQVLGTWVGNVIVEGSIDGITYFTLSDKSGNSLAAITSNARYYVDVSGYTRLRVRMSAFTSGQADISVATSIAGSSSSSGGGGASTIADGADVNAGSTTDAAVVTDANGTLSGKLRGLVKMIASVWDSTNNLLRVRRVKADTFGTTTAFTITLGSLANSTVGVGRQSTLITGNTAESALIGVKVTVGTTPTANSLIYVYLLRGDGTLKDDNAGTSDAGLTVVNAPLLGTILVPATTTDAAYYAVLDTKPLGSLGPVFGVALVNSSGVALNSTNGNHVIEYTPIT